MKRRRLGGVRFAPPRTAPYGGLLGRAVTSCRPVTPGKAISVCVTRPDKPGPALRSADDVCRLLKRSANADRESFFALHLDVGNRVIGIEEVARGTLAAVEVSPREVFKSAFLSNAASLIVAHNHPSGAPEPSAMDLEMTRKLNEAGKLLGVPVRDHVIIGAESCISLRERGVSGFGGPRRRR